MSECECNYKSLLKPFVLRYWHYLTIELLLGQPSAECTKLCFVMAFAKKTLNKVLISLIVLCVLVCVTSLSFYRAMHFSAKRGIAIACRLFVCLSVTLVDCDHIGWNSSKIISPLVSL